MTTRDTPLVCLTITIISLGEKGWSSGDRAPASNQCAPASNPEDGVISGLSFSLFLVLVRRVFLRVLRFYALHKNQPF